MLYLSSINEYNYNYCNIPAVILANVVDNIYDWNDIWQIYGSTEYIKGVEMNWKEIYKKYEDTELMAEFWEKNKLMLGIMDFDELDNFHIKDIWGYLIVFAETKGYLFYMDYEILSDVDNWQGTIVDKDNIVKSTSHPNYKSVEQSMLWCADKFFEVTK